MRCFCDDIKRQQSQQAGLCARVRAREGRAATARRILHAAQRLQVRFETHLDDVDEIVHGAVLLEEEVSIVDLVLLHGTAARC